MHVTSCDDLKTYYQNQDIESPAEHLLSEQKRFKGLPADTQNESHEYFKLCNLINKQELSFPEMMRLADLNILMAAHDITPLCMDYDCFLEDSNVQNKQI